MRPRCSDAFLESARGSGTVRQIYTLQRTARPVAPERGLAAQRRGAASSPRRDALARRIGTASRPDAPRRGNSRNGPNRAGKLRRGCAGANRTERVAARHSAPPLGRILTAVRGGLWSAHFRVVDLANCIQTSDIRRAAANRLKSGSERFESSRPAQTLNTAPRPCTHRVSTTCRVSCRIV